eukprot:m.126683 g.126683  ORF g.126683 m.126683 type:complete len:74 (+) comp15779_c0_seq1:87-308(+)
MLSMTQFGYHVNESFQVSSSVTVVENFNWSTDCSRFPFADRMRVYAGSNMAVSALSQLCTTTYYESNYSSIAG